MDDFRSRKAARIAYNKKFVEGWKLVTCGACNGSGYYDNNGSPKCGNCGGTGKERVSPEDYLSYVALEARLSKQAKFREKFNLNDEIARFEKYLSTPDLEKYAPENFKVYSELLAEFKEMRERRDKCL